MDLRRAGEAVSVLVADDGPSFDHALTDGLTADNVTVVGHALGRREAVDLVRTLGPDIVLLDMTDPEAYGTGAIREIRRLAPGTRVIVLTDSHTSWAVGGAGEAGAVGYICTDELSPDVLRFVVALSALMNRAGS